VPAIHLLPPELINQIAAGEVVERPASVVKELIENAIDAGATTIDVLLENGGKQKIEVRDNGCGMSRQDATLAIERHATSKIRDFDDLTRVRTLGFRGEALASIASVARVELTSSTQEAAAATRVLIEGGKMREVKDAAHPRGTSIAVRDLFFNVPARRKFLRSEATESFHLTNLVTHYALAHPEIAFTLTNNGREVLRVSPAQDLRERAYQIFGAEFLDNLLEVNGGHATVARVSGFVSAPRDRRTSRDAQYLFVNGRFVRDRLISRALSEGYRAILPHGVYPAALLFLETPLEEVDVNVHPAKTEVRFRRNAAVAEAVREAVRAALASGGFVRPEEAIESAGFQPVAAAVNQYLAQHAAPPPDSSHQEATPLPLVHKETEQGVAVSARAAQTARETSDPVVVASTFPEWANSFSTLKEDRGATALRQQPITPEDVSSAPACSEFPGRESETALPPLASAEKFVREVPVESLHPGIRPLGQLDESFIIATDGEGLLLIDQHVAHERVLFDKYRALEASRPPESQRLLIPETFDLTPAQAAVFDSVATEMENYGFALMRLSGRTVAIKATPADLPASEARNMLAEVLDTVDADKKGSARETVRDDIAASLACHAAIKVNMSLTAEKMRWLIDRLLQTSSPTTCPHGRPVILRLTTKDILKGFHRI